VALTKLGRWYDRTSQAESARFVYQSAARLVEKADGEKSPAMVDPLLAIAETYRQQYLLPPDPDSREEPLNLLPMSSQSLRKALAIVDQEEPPDPAQRARILVALGDLYMMWDKQNTADDRYKEAWQALSGDLALEGRRDEYFARPARIMGPLPPTIFPPPSRKAAPPAVKDLEPGFVVVRFNVDQFGRVSEATVIEADPINLLEARVAQAAKNALFRPRYVDGAPVSTTGLILRHEFRYAPKKLEKKDAPAAEEGSKPLEQPSSGTGG
jgi:TonB family protein